MAEPAETLKMEGSDGLVSPLPPLYLFTVGLYLLQSPFLELAGKP